MSIKFDVVRRPGNPKGSQAIFKKLTNLKTSDALRISGRKKELQTLASSLRTMGYRHKRPVHYKAARGYILVWIQNGEGQQLPRQDRSDKGHKRISPDDRKNQLISAIVASGGPLRGNTLRKVTGMPMSSIYSLFKKYTHVFVQYSDKSWGLR